MVIFYNNLSIVDLAIAMSGNTKGSTPLKPPDDLPTLPTLPRNASGRAQSFCASVA